MPNPLDIVSHREVWRLAAPIIVSNVSVPLVGAVDTAVMGHLDGPEHLGGIALGALVFGFVFWGFGFLRMGTTGFVARAWGRGERREIQQTLLRGLLLALILGTALIALRRPLNDLAMAILGGSPEVEALAAEYVAIRIFSAPATLGVYVLTGVMIGMHDTRAALWLQLVLNVTNVLLDLLLVPGLGYGIAGVAAASLVAEYLALGFGLWQLRGIIAGWPIDARRIFDLEALTLLLRTNLDLFVRTLCLVFSFSLFTALGSRFGEVVLAANAVLMNLQNILAHGLDGFAHAAEALGGSAAGAGDRARFRSAVRRTTQWAAATGLLVSGLYLAFGESLIGLFTDLDEVRRTAVGYLPWIVASPLLSIWSFQLDGIFIGTSRSAEMRNAMLVSTAAYLGLLWLLLPRLDNHGLWAALMAFMVIRALTLGAFYPALERSIGGPPPESRRRRRPGR